MLMERLPSNPNELTVRRRFGAFILLLLLFLLLPMRAKAQSTEGAQIYLPIISTGAGQGAPSTGPTSIQLIDAAVLAGTLSDEQGLLYRVQAVVGDAALPSEYLGNEAGLDGSLVMAEAVTKVDTLSAATAAALRPYLLPPASAGSWFATQTANAAAQDSAQAGWDTVTTANGKVKIWYHPETASHGARAVAIANAMNNKIWPELTTWLREPLPDCGASCSVGGGGESIDIYMVNTRRAYMQPFTCCSGSSGFMLIRPDSTFGEIVRVFTQIIEFAYPMASLNEYRWVIRATSVYAMEYVYPSANQDPDYPKRNEEHQWADDYLYHTLMPLGTVNDSHELGAYLFFYFISDPSIVPDVLANAMMPDSMANINNQLANGFREQWPHFALENWNRAPVDYYNRNDQLSIGPELADEYVMDAAGTSEFIIDIEALTAYYFRFTFPDKELKRIAIRNPIAGAGQPTAALWAIMKIDGTWRTPQDWTNESTEIFCRNEPNQNLEELILVLSNSEWQAREHVVQTEDGSVRVTPECGDQLTGTITWKFDAENQLPSGGKSSYHQTTVINVKLRYDEAAEGYVDDGSTFNHTGQHYAEGHSTTTGELGYIVEWAESGSGNFSGDQKQIKGSVAFHETTPDESWIGAHILIRKTGSTTYYPSGHNVPFDGEEEMTITCDDPTGIRGERNENGAFVINCNVQVPGANHTTQASGTLNLQ